MKWFIARRVLWTILALGLLLSATFFAFALTPDPNRQLRGQMAAMGAAMSGGDPSKAAQEAMQAYDEARNRDRPLSERYLDWMLGYATGDWGWSFTHDAPVEEVLADAIWKTAKYLIPGVLLGTLLSIIAGLYGALRRGGWLDRSIRLGVFLGLSVPGFFLAVAFLRWGPGWLQGEVLAPALVVAINLFAIQTWVVRSEAMQIVPEEFVKTLRAGGAGDTTIGRHVLRNATSPLLATFVTEVLVVLYLTVFVVEIILGISGIGLVGYRGFQEREIGIILAVVMLPAAVGLGSSLLKDVVASFIDPRISHQ